MAETPDEHIHSKPAVLDIGEDVGALIIYTPPELKGWEIEVSLRGAGVPRTHTAVLERQVGDRSIFAALFLALPAGDYGIETTDPTLPNTVTITGGAVAEIDWRSSAHPLSGHTRSRNIGVL
jgi:hypothetical protein